MHSVFLMLGLMQSISEEGYLYSVYTESFLNYKSSKSESRIFVSKPGKKPHKFKIKELEGAESGSLRIMPIDNGEKDIVLDRSGYNADLIQYESHGGKNQVWKMTMVPKMMVKLEVDGKCIEAKQDNFYLKAEKCDSFENTPGQYFRWLPSPIVDDTIGSGKKGSATPEYGPEDSGNGEEKEKERQRPRYSLGDPNCGDPQASKAEINYRPKVRMEEGQCNVPMHQNISKARTSKEESLKSNSKYSTDFVGDEDLLEQLHQFQKDAIDTGKF